MNSRKWIKNYLFIILFFGILMASINYIVDPFGIFNNRILKHQFEQNERFTKVNFLEEYNQLFNGYMFGSSRIGTTSTETIEKYIQNSKIYNFTIASGSLYDYLTHLKYFIKRGYPIHTLYLQLDIDAMESYEHDKYDYLRKLHPYVVNDSLWSFYSSYLTKFFPLNTKGKILNNIKDATNDRHYVNYDLKTGSWIKPNLENEIKRNCRKYINTVSSFHNPKFNNRYKYTESTSRTIKALMGIKQLTDENNIKLYLFITPHNQNLVNLFKVDDYLRYLKDISNVTDFYDFSGYNSVTTNNCNYYEQSHYRQNVADLIAARIFTDEKIIVPEDFGVLVTKENIESLLTNLKKQIKIYRSKIEIK